jgi:hypothetical protein
MFDPVPQKEPAWFLAGTARKPLALPNAYDLNALNDYENVLTDRGGPAWSQLGDDSALSGEGSCSSGHGRAGLPPGQLPVPGWRPHPRPDPKSSTNR